MSKTVNSEQQAVDSKNRSRFSQCRESSKEELTTVCCSLTTATLPARLDDAGNLSLERQCTEAQTANAELAQETARSPAELAPIVLAAAELRLPRVFHPFCSGCHKSSSKNSYQLLATSF
jgi:hypothetical protein